MPTLVIDSNYTMFVPYGTLFWFKEALESSATASLQLPYHSYSFLTTPLPYHFLSTPEGTKSRVEVVIITETVGVQKGPHERM